MQGCTVVQNALSSFTLQVIYFAFNSYRPASSHNFAVSLTICPRKASELIIFTIFALRLERACI